MSNQINKSWPEVTPTVKVEKPAPVVWRELLVRKSFLGLAAYTIYVTDYKYEITRFTSSASGVDTVLTGVFWDCDNDEERFDYIMEEFQGLLTLLKDDWSNRHRPDTEEEADIKEREQLLRYKR